MALRQSQACVEDAFVSASAPCMFSYHLIKDHYCFAANSNSSLLRNPILVAACHCEAKFWLLSSWKKDPVSTSFPLQQQKAQAPSTPCRPSFQKEGAVVERHFIPQFWYAESVFSVSHSYIGFLRQHCEGKVLNFTANTEFWTGYWALLANFRKPVTSKAGGIKSTVLRKQTYTSVCLVDFFVWLFQAP